MNWLITGGSGQLALCLAESLKRVGESYLTLSRKELDISSSNSIPKIEDLVPGIIVNCAAYTSVDKAESEPDLAFATNSLGSKNVALAARNLKIPLIHISTDYVFSGEGSVPWTINSPTQPSTIYGKSKLAGEQEINAVYPEGSFILRTAWLYSASGTNFAKSILRKAIEGVTELKVVSDQIGQPTSAKELADQIVDLSKTNATPGTFHVTNSGQASWYEFAREIFTLNGFDPNRIISIPSDDYKSLAQRPKFSVLDGSSWNNLALPRMSHWKTALGKVIPKIREQVEREARIG